jgi:hypothetical protein
LAKLISKLEAHPDYVPPTPTSGEPEQTQATKVLSPESTPLPSSEAPTITDAPKLAQTASAPLPAAKDTKRFGGEPVNIPIPADAVAAIESSAEAPNSDASLLAPIPSVAVPAGNGTKPASGEPQMMPMSKNAAVPAAKDTKQSGGEAVKIPNPTNANFELSTVVKAPQRLPPISAQPQVSVSHAHSSATGCTDLVSTSLNTDSENSKIVQASPAAVPQAADTTEPEESSQPPPSISNVEQAVGVKSEAIQAHLNLSLHTVSVPAVSASDPLLVGTEVSQLTSHDKSAVSPSPSQVESLVSADQFKEADEPSSVDGHHAVANISSSFETSQTSTSEPQPSKPLFSSVGLERRSPAPCLESISSQSPPTIALAPVAEQRSVSLAIADPAVATVDDSKLSLQELQRQICDQEQLISSINTQRLRLKKEIKQWMDKFVADHGVEPTTEQKEPARGMYENYAQVLTRELSCTLLP